MDRYNVHQIIGEGTFGVVYFAENKTTGEKVSCQESSSVLFVQMMRSTNIATLPSPHKRALKRIKEEVTWDRVREMREFRSLYKLPPHKNIVKLYEVMLEANSVWFSFEYMEGGSLKEIIKYRTEKNLPQLPDFAIRDILEQVLFGINHMHVNNMYHRDLKPENILFDGKRASVADFSMVRGVFESTAVTSYVSTRWYRAPEIMLISKRYSAPVDMFAVGCIGAELYSQQPLFPGSDEIDQLRRIFAMVGTPMYHQWDEGLRLLQHYHQCVNWDKNTPPILKLPGVNDTVAHALLMSLLQLDPDRRLTAERALHHEYFGVADAPQSCESTKSPTVVTLSPSPSTANPYYQRR